MSETTHVKVTKINRGKVVLSLLTVILVMLLSYVVSVAYNLLVSDKIYEGVVVDGITASGMSKEELKDILYKKYNISLSNKNIIITAKNFSENINFEKARLKYDINSSVEKAYSFGRDGNFFSRFVNLSLAKTATNQINIDYSYDKEHVKNIVSSFSKKINLPVKEYSITQTPASKVSLVTGHRGESIMQDELITSIEESFRNFKDGNIVPKILTVMPKEITIDTLYSKVNTEPKNATFEINNNKLNIVPHVLGRKIDKSVLTSAVADAKSKEDVEIPLQVTLIEPQLKTKDVEAKIFRDNLSSYSTQFYTGDKNNDNRKVNITIAATKINGTVIGPDDVFSFNDVVGPRTPENGYKDAHAYVGGKIVDSTGGGICQVSTTLYNATLFADFTILNRQNHMFTVGYVPKGRDAAVSYGSADLSFENNTKWPIKVLCSVSPDNKIFFTLKGTNENSQKTVDFRQETVKELQPNVVNINEPTMDEGKTEVTSEGMMGYIVDTFKITKQNGKVVSEIKIHTSRYEPYPKQIKVGTKKPQPTNTQATPVIPTPQATKGVDDSYNPPAKVQ